MSSPESSVLEEVRVSLANLSEESQQQVLEAVEFAEATHTTDELDVRQVVQDAEAADYHRAQADEYQQLQAKAASDGNWEEAREYAARAEGELESVAEAVAVRGFHDETSALRAAVRAPSGGRAGLIRVPSPCGLRCERLGSGPAALIAQLLPACLPPAGRLPARHRCHHAENARSRRRRAGASQWHG